MVALVNQYSHAKVFVIYSKSSAIPLEFQLESDLRSQRSQELLAEARAAFFSFHARQKRKHSSFT